MYAADSLSRWPQDGPRGRGAAPGLGWCTGTAHVHGHTIGDLALPTGWGHKHPPSQRGEGAGDANMQPDTLAVPDRLWPRQGTAPSPPGDTPAATQQKPLLPTSDEHEAQRELSSRSGSAEAIASWADGDGALCSPCKLLPFRHH